MIPLSQITKVESAKGNKSIFVVEGLYPGYGVTLGNSLRRVLLSSLEGAAVTQAKIKGVTHEFSGIPGIMEDAVGLLLNLKQLRFKMFGEGPYKATLKITGEKDVKASSFEFPAQVELVSKDAPIATLTDKSSQLEMEITIEKGVGYESAESRKGGKEEIGSLVIDSTYTPVIKVNYRIEQMRVGDKTDFDRLIVEVETDGTMTPETAFWQASDILVRQFEIVRSGVTPEEVKIVPDVTEEVEKDAEGEDKPKKKKIATKKKIAKK